ETAAHRSRLATPELLADADLVIVMEPRQTRRLPTVARRAAVIVLGDLDPGPVRRRSIRDPWGEEDGLYAEVFERIDRCVDEMVRILEPTPGRRDAPVGSAPYAPTADGSER
ncbi:MAG TPA: hypothetical protein VLL48_06960, partial [Longimicrobiales bacterium]|nr:hypothetical protein [Longimicrobiales bacterium]